MGLELHLYDFDGTLFRSPHPPAFWKGSWWGSVESLMPPCVPDDPTPDWWIPKSVNAAKASISNPDVFAVLMTGRVKDTGLRWRVPELLAQVGLRFDRVFLSDGGDTQAFKVKKLKQLLMQLPDLQKVIIWDDNAQYAKAYETLLHRYDVPEIEIHLVRERPKPSACDSNPAPAPSDTHTFLGAFLDSASKGRVIGAFPPLFGKQHVDHITLAYMTKADDIQRLAGQTFKALVVGEAHDDYGQAVQVELVSPERQDTQLNSSNILHLTISTVEGVPPKYSNSLMSKMKPIHSRVVLTGTIGTGR